MGVMVTIAALGVHEQSVSTHKYTHTHTHTHTHTRARARAHARSHMHHSSINLTPSLYNLVSLCRLAVKALGW